MRKTALFILSVCFAVPIDGCQRHVPPSVPIASLRKPVVLSPKPPVLRPTGSERDCQVVQAVTAHLVTRYKQDAQEKDSPSMKKLKRSGIKFFLSIGKYQVVVETPPKLPPITWQEISWWRSQFIPEFAARDSGGSLKDILYALKHPHRWQLAGCQLASKDVTVGPIPNYTDEFADAFFTRYPQAFKWIRVNAIGYSPDGDRALVMFSLRPVIHATECVFTLLWKQDHWAVVSPQSYHYV